MNRQPGGRHQYIMNCCWQFDIWCKQHVWFNCVQCPATSRCDSVALTFASVTSRHTASWPLRHAVLPDNYWLQIITKRNIFAGEMYSATCVEWAVDLFFLVWRKCIRFLTKIFANTFSTTSLPMTLTFRRQVWSPSYSCPALCFH